MTEWTTNEQIAFVVFSFLLGVSVGYAAAYGLYGGRK
jgi:hypothetical protein